MHTSITNSTENISINLRRVPNIDIGFPFTFLLPHSAFAISQCRWRLRSAINSLGFPCINIRNLRSFGTHVVAFPPCFCVASIASSWRCVIRIIAGLLIFVPCLTSWVFLSFSLCHTIDHESPDFVFSFGSAQTSSICLDCINVKDLRRLFWLSKCKQ